jgi:serine/threonine-protein kinase RsbW
LANSLQGAVVADRAGRVYLRTQKTQPISFPFRSLAMARTESPNIRLDLRGTPDNVVLIREILAGLARAANVSAYELIDIKTAVSEACDNVVLHAYRQDTGSLEVEFAVENGSLSALVRDRGIGLEDLEWHHDDRAAQSDGLGLHIIRTLTNRLEFDEPDGGGTEVHMGFPAARAVSLTPSLKAVGSPSSKPMRSMDEVKIDIAPPELGRAVLTRLGMALAARAHFSTDELSGIEELLGVLLAQNPSDEDGERLRATIGVAPGALHLKLHKLPPGRAQALIDGSQAARADDGRAGEHGERVDSDWQVQANGSGDVLLLSVRSR